MRKLLIVLLIFISICSYRLMSLKEDFSYQKEYIYGLTAPRGRILDRNGKILVDNIGVRSLVFNKLSISTKETMNVARKLNDIISLDMSSNKKQKRYCYYINNEEEVNKRVSDEVKTKYKERRINKKEYDDYKYSLITDEEIKNINENVCALFYQMNNGYSYEDKLIKKNLTDDEYEMINTSNLKGIRTDITWERYYPYGNTLREVFGTVSSYKQGIPKEFKNKYLKIGYNLSDRVGTSNLEYIYDEYLKGEKAKYEINDNHLKLIKKEETGKDIVLNIDIDLQKYTETVLEKEIKLAKKHPNSKYFDTSFVIISNPNDGSILTMAGRKLTNNGEFIDYSYENIFNSYVAGSIVKGATISVGYKYDLIPQKKILDGCVKLSTTKDKCSWKSLGYMDAKEALRMSSNYYQYLLAIKLTGKNYSRGMNIGATKEHFEIYRNVLKDYGLGTLSKIDLTNEGTGYKGTSITDDQLLNMAIGQYDTYTPISLTSYINTIATSKRNKLSLLNMVLNKDGTVYYKNKSEVLSTAPINETDLNEIREGFRLVNYSGTGYGYVSNKVKSAGKTGTSESFIDTNNDGIVDLKTVSTTYGTYFPYDSPKISIVIVSPNIKYSNKNSEYKYPINRNVISKISKEIIENHL